MSCTVFTNSIYYTIVNENQSKKYWNLKDQGWEELSEHLTKEEAISYIKEFYPEYINNDKICRHCGLAEGDLARIQYHHHSETNSKGEPKTINVPKIYICEQCANNCIEVKYL